MYPNSDAWCLNLMDFGDSLIFYEKKILNNRVKRCAGCLYLKQAFVNCAGIRISGAFRRTTYRTSNPTRWRKGFESLFRNHYQPLCRYATTLVNDPDEAEEIVQQVFIQIWERRGALEINLTSRHISTKLCGNSSLNKIKHGKVRRFMQKKWQHSLLNLNRPAKWLFRMNCKTNSFCNWKFTWTMQDYFQAESIWRIKVCWNRWTLKYLRENCRKPNGKSA